MTESHVQKPHGPEHFFPNQRIKSINEHQAAKTSASSLLWLDPSITIT
jgi:hypothetical protein